MEETQEEDAQALQLIKQGVDRVAFQKIMITFSAKGAWDILAKIYKGMTKVNIVRLQNTRIDFESL